MPLWLNAANAVLVTSDYEGFGMAAVEALACEVPVLSTAVGIAPYALAGIEGCLCAEFEPERWAAVARRHLDATDPRVTGERARRVALGCEHGRAGNRGLPRRDRHPVIDWTCDECRVRRFQRFREPQRPGRSGRAAS